MRTVILAAVVASLGAGCRRDAAPPSLQIVGEAARPRLGEDAGRSPYFDGHAVTLRAARGEILGLTILHRGGPLQLTIDGIAVALAEAEAVTVRRPSTALWGPGRGAGAYPELLRPAAAPSGGAGFVELTVPRDATPGRHVGELTVDDRRISVALEVVAVTLPPLDHAPRVWAYYDPRELRWTDGDAASERACVALLRRHGVLLAPDLSVEDWASHRDAYADVARLPARLSDDPATAATEVKAWLAATAGTGQVPFGIPVDEPRTAAAQARVAAVGAAVRAAGGGPGRFLMAVTDAPRLAYDGVVDLYLSPKAPRLDDGGRVGAAERWTYNGAPPRAGAMTLDAEGPALRTWGWIAWRWKIPVWYVWDALYWHDRHNRHGAPLPGKALVLGDAISFDDGEDHGDLDGVLALPDGHGGCVPTLRLATLRRGLQDRALLELAAACAPDAASAVAARMVPRALGDADGTSAGSWPTDDAAWEAARQELLTVAAGCARP
jgi:hypothetical protein